MTKKDVRASVFSFNNIEVGIVFYLDHKTFYIDCLGNSARFTKESVNYSYFSGLDGERMQFIDTLNNNFLTINNNMRIFTDFCEYIFNEYKQLDFDFEKMQEKFCNSQVITNG